MALKSKTKFKKQMAEAGLVEGEDYTINFEAYGRKVEGYVYPKGDVQLDELKDTILYNLPDGLDFKARKQASCNRVIIQVSYFKAYGWNH
jgi:hypothetical protein